MKPSSFLILMLLLSVNNVQAKLLISEVLYDTPGSDNLEEWVELYNSGCEQIDLGLYTLSDNSQTYYLSGKINAGEYVTIARDANGFNTLYQTQPNHADMTLSLNNNGDWIELSSAGATVDFVAWENAKPGWTIFAKHHSIYRQSSTDTNTVADWAVSSNDSPATGSLTTICPNPGDPTPNETDHAQYYKDAIGLSGVALKAALQKIISNTYKRLTYKEVWSALQYTDEDPHNTNNVILLYTGRSHDKDDRDGQPGSNNDSWNREHVWAKSLGFANQNQYGYTDIHHIRPADKTVNSSRGAKDFDNGGSVHREAPDTFSDSNSWEPRDSIKGDVARMIFYMDTRYNGSDGNMPDLMVVHHTNTSTADPEIGVLCTLIDWHLADPVNTLERQRNNRIYEIQLNRNPFIDNPHWVQSIWADQCY